MYALPVGEDFGKKALKIWALIFGIIIGVASFFPSITFLLLLNPKEIYMPQSKTPRFLTLIIKISLLSQGCAGAEPKNSSRQELTARKEEAVSPATRLGDLVKSRPEVTVFPPSNSGEWVKIRAYYKYGKGDAFPAGPCQGQKAGSEGIAKASPECLSQHEDMAEIAVSPRCEENTWLQRPFCSQSVENEVGPLKSAEVEPATAPIESNGASRNLFYQSITSDRN